MKTLAFSVALCTLSIVAYGQTGQIVNGDFEDWTEKDSTIELVDWIHNGSLTANRITRVEDGHHGNYGCRLETTQNDNLDTVSAYVIFGDNSTGTTRPAFYPSFVDSFVFYGRWDMAPGDTGMIQVVQYIDGNPQPVYNTKYYWGTQTDWTRVALNLISPGQDSIRVMIHTRAYGTDEIETPGSYMEMDQLHFVDQGSTPEPLPNFSFENWYVNKYSDPDGFYSLNQVFNTIGRVPNTNRTTDAYSGDYAVKITPDTTSPIIGVLTNAFYEDWQLESGIPYTAMPDSFSGFYKANVADGDSSLIQLYFSKNDTIIFYKHIYIDSTVDWTPINWAIDLPQKPDTMRIYARTSTVIGTELYLDEFKFHGGDLGVEEKELAFGIYPNPSTGRVTLNANSYMRAVEVYSANGMLVGRYSPKSDMFDYDFGFLPKGVYVVLVRTDFGVGMRRFVRL